MSHLIEDAKRQHVTLKQSTISGAGLGVFSTKEYAAKDIVGYYNFAMLTNKECRIWGQRFGLEPYRSTRMLNLVALNKGKVDTEDHWLADGFITCAMTHINDWHNSGIKNNVELIFNETLLDAFGGKIQNIERLGYLPGTAIQVIATRTIQPGEELLLDYGYKSGINTLLELVVRLVFNVVFCVLVICSQSI